MKQYDNRMEEKAYEACKRQTSIKLHKRLYWRSSRPKWPLIIESESYNKERREKILKKIQKDLHNSGYITEFKQEHLGIKILTLVILGLK